MSFTSPYIDKAYGIGCEDANLIGDFSKVISREICLSICQSWLFLFVSCLRGRP